MKRKVGEIFEYNGEWYQCVKDDMYDYCKGCASFENLRCTTLYGNRDCWLKATCKKLEKVGEPFVSGGKLYQHYKVFDIDNIDFNKCTNMNVHNYNKKTLTVEIKQTKEDMEEKNNKLIEELDNLFKKHNIYISDSVCESMACEIGTWLAPQNNEEHSNSESIGRNLKPFDLEAARSGKPVCTRDGRKARIVCFDAKGDQPIIALVEAKGNKDALIEKVERYFINGHSVFEVRGTNNDLMMLPEKKEGWINIYESDDSNFAAIVGSSYVYKTKEGAVDNSDPDTTIATVKIEWEE